MYGGYSTVNLSQTTQPTNAIWEYNFHNFSWHRISANNTPNVPFLLESKGSKLNSTLYVSGIDPHQSPKITRYYSVDINSMRDGGGDWKEIPANRTMQQLKGFAFTATNLGVFLIGGYFVNNTKYDMSNFNETESAVTMHSCSRFDFDVQDWIKCNNINANVHSSAASFNKDVKMVLAFGGMQQNRSASFKFSEKSDPPWIAGQSTSGESPWNNFGIEKDILPNRYSSCVLPCKYLLSRLGPIINIFPRLSDSNGFIIYGGSSSNDRGEFHHNDIYYVTIGEDNAINTLNITSSITLHSDNNLPLWGSAPSCLIIESTLYLVGLPPEDEDLRSHLQSLRHRIIGLDLSNPVTFFVPESRPLPIQAKFIAAPVVFGMIFIVMCSVAIYYKVPRMCWKKRKRTPEKKSQLKALKEAKVPLEVPSIVITVAELPENERIRQPLQEDETRHYFSQ
ncbi:hypothetical protein HK098_005319 [Nowakowskiella sp. JEL0407]|nr:hypothetical protein HK098_005319 [Nowakowskiella sp. JEL0407]